jgi:predicted flap endonuclease-1-like 5' DNA nuclease
MPWIRSVTRSVTHGVRGLASGVFAAVATPLVYTPLRPLAKRALKGGFWLAHGARSLLEVTQEEWGDLVTEARAEVRSGDVPPRLEAGSPTGSDARSTSWTTAADEAASPPGGATEAPPGPGLTAVKGIGDDYARLLRAAGVSSVEQLATRDADALRGTLHEANDREGLVGRVPSADRIRSWIERAAQHAD